MPDLVPDPDAVFAATGDTQESQPVLAIAGEELVQGEAASYSEITNRWNKAINDTAVHAGEDGVAIVLTHSFAEQPVALLRDGNIDLGCALVVGEEYYISANAGKIKPFSELGSGEFRTRVGIADETDNLRLQFDATGIEEA